jgi:hypothetical protein
MKSSSILMAYGKLLDNMQPVAPAKSEEMEPSEQIEQLRVAILDKMEAVRHLRTKLRVECVPSSVCTYLSQCLKDTNVGLAISV